MSKSYELTSTFVRALDSYYNTFEEWKKQDTAKIVDGMINHWLELERLWFSVRHTQLDADTNWRPKIASQQKSIYAKLSKFGKASLQKLRDEQKKMRSELGVESEDESISGSESDGGVSSSYESDTNSDALMSTSPHRFPSSPKPGRRGSAQSVSKSPKPGRKLDFSVDTISAVKQEEAPKVPPSPSIVSEASASSSSSASKFGAYLSNERLAHELVRDPEFELKPNQYASKLEEQVTIMAKKAFFDAARDQFNKGIFINFVPSLLEDIKKVSIFMSMHGDGTQLP